MRMFEQFPIGHLDKIGTPVVADLWPRRPAWAVASISEFDASFFAGLVMETKPSRLLEIGVASGWGSCVLLEALRTAGLHASDLYGVDIADRFFYDASYATGQCVHDVLPDRLPRYHLATNLTMGEFAAGQEVDGLEFVFIDAHHMHPWATLDLLAAMPFVKPHAWIAMHDLNLSLKEDQEHQNRGPKYLFEGWDQDKIHSVQVPTMAGAIRLDANPASHLPLLLDILYTPWEIPVDSRACNPVCALVARAYGESWAQKFRRAFEVGNYQVNKMHRPDGDARRADRPESSGKRRWVRRWFGERAG